MAYKCICADCRGIGVHKIGVDKRGGRPAYMCDFHYRHNEGYGHGGDNMAGAKNKVRKNQYCFGVEFETSWTSPKARIELMANGFKPTNDISLEGVRTCEYVSPLYFGMNSIVRYVKSIEKYMKRGDIEMNETCGTHFHISLNNMYNDSGNVMEYLQNDILYFTLFKPLSDALAADSAKCERVFGRPLNSHYASRIEDYTIEEVFNIFGAERVFKKLYDSDLESEEGIEELEMFKNTHFSDLSDYEKESICAMIAEGVVDSRITEDRYQFINVTNSNNIEFRVFCFRNAEQYTNAMWFARDILDSIMRCTNSFNQMTVAEQIRKCEVMAQKFVKKYEKM